jgi:RNA polymerase sigma-70 factor (ECF subfamily)
MTFTSTHWSVVLGARGESDEARKALERLCATYWLPLYAFVRRMGFSEQDAEDATQEFFAQLTAQDFLAQINPANGRFRSFLLAALKHFLSKERARTGALKRGGKKTIESLDGPSAEARYALETAVTRTPEQIFDRCWATALLEKVLGELGDEYAAAGKRDTFEKLKFTLTGSKANERYAQIALNLNLSEGGVKVAVHRLRQRYRRRLMDEIANTVGTPAAADEELNDLFAALRL